MKISFPPFTLAGALALPEGARSVVLLTDGSGSSRSSATERLIAQTLVDAGIGAFLVDLLDAEEEPPAHDRRAQRLDVELLAGRLVVVTDWVRSDRATAGLAIGYFSHGTGAAAALVAAAERSGDVRAVVCAGGRVDLAGAALASLRAPTLLIAGARNQRALEVHRRVLDRLPAGGKAMEVVPVVREPLEDLEAAGVAARIATSWFERFLGR